MAFDEKLAARVRKQLEGSGALEKPMFGGLAFLLGGNMSVGIHRTELIVRVAPETAGELLKEPGARVFDLTGRPMKGWILVGAGGIEKPAALSKWVGRGLAYAASLPKKAKKRSG